MREDNNTDPELIQTLLDTAHAAQEIAERCISALEGFGLATPDDCLDIAYPADPLAALIDSIGEPVPDTFPTEWLAK